MLVTRTPLPSLRPFVRRLWAIEAEAARVSDAPRELVLPTGASHVVFRIGDEPLRIFDRLDDPVGRVIQHAVVGGVRARYYVRDVSRPVGSVGAELQPGAAQLLFGATAAELADRHTPLFDLWGRAAEQVRERLLDAGRPERQLDVFESLLAERLPKPRALHPAIAHALERFNAESEIAEVVRETGYSHRRFIALFREAVGLTPKVYCRVLRFRSALERISDGALVELALDAGYADQAHLSHEFRELAGISPRRYREAAPRFASHVPLRP